MYKNISSLLLYFILLMNYPFTWFFQWQSIVLQNTPDSCGFYYSIIIDWLCISKQCYFYTYRIYIYSFPTCYVYIIPFFYSCCKLVHLPWLDIFSGFVRDKVWLWKWIFHQVDMKILEYIYLSDIDPPVRFEHVF